jgi:peptidoglycan/LPS O-acetylase OafA/YrhL
MFGTLQSCRAFAAVLVVLFHLGAITSLDKYFGLGWMARPFAFGHAGVDFFFVLSGFIIVHVHERDFGHAAQLATYLKKRLIRIYPVYWLVFAAVCIAALPFPSLRETLPSDVGVIIKSLLLMPQDPVVVGGTGAPVLVVAWSLQFEILFYGVMAAFIVNRLLGVAVVATFAAMYLWRPFGSTFPFSFIQSDWILLFALGASVAYFNRSSFRLRWPLVWAALGLLLFLGNGLLEVFGAVVEVSGASHFLYGSASALMIIGLIRAEAVGSADKMKPRWAMLLGDASYALYLIHFPLISVVCKIAVAAGMSGMLGASITFIGGLVASLAAAVLFHLYVEKPLLRYLGTKLKSSQRKVAAIPAV